MGARHTLLLALIAASITFSGAFEQFEWRPAAASWARRLRAQRDRPQVPTPPPMRGDPPQPIPAAVTQPLKVAAVMDVSLADEEVVPSPDQLPRALGAPSPEDLRALKLINQRRAQHGAAPLSWDPQLAAGAKGYSKWCPLGHSGARGLGESMAWGGKDWAATVKGWYGGSRAFDWSNPGFNSTAADFAQMVWTTTAAVGCAVEGKCAGGPLYLCYYSPAGNVIGVDWEKHVLPERRDD